MGCFFSFFFFLLLFLFLSYLWQLSKEDAVVGIKQSRHAETVPPPEEGIVPLKEGSSYKRTFSTYFFHREFTTAHELHSPALKEIVSFLS